MTRKPSLRLTIVGPVSPYRGGIAQFTDTIADGLRQRGHEVQVVTFSRQYPKILFRGKSQFEPKHGRFSSDALRVIDSMNPVSWVQAAREIAQHDPDAVLFQYWLPYFAPAYGTITGRLQKRSLRVFAVVHNVVPHERKMGDVQLGQYFLRKCEGFLALSDSVAQDLKSLEVEAPIRVAAHPVYEHFGEPVSRADARERIGLSQDAEVLLFFGFVREYKGLKILLQAMPEIAEKRPNVRLVVAGEFYDDQEPYLKMIEDYRLDGRVQVVANYIPAEEVADYFSAANLVVQPYETASQSGVVQTAYNFDRPVVVTDVGGLAEVVSDGESGFVVPRNDPSALAMAVTRFFEDDLEAGMVEGVRREKGRHTWGRLLDTLEEMVT